MFGKGAKRKLDEDEAGLEGKALEVVVGSGGGGGPHPSPEGLSKVSYTLQRQTIFNISLMKLYSQRPLAEPRLERRVLINNMLRRIQEELQAEGSLRPLLLPPSPPPDDPMDEGFREAPPPFGALSAAQPSSLLAPPPPPPSPHPLAPPPQRVEPCPAPPLEAGLTPASLLEEDGSGRGRAPPLPTPPLSPPLPAAAHSHASRLLPAPRVLAPAGSLALSDIEGAPPPAAVAAVGRTAGSATASTSPPPHPFAPLAAAPAGHHKDCRPVEARAEADGVLLELKRPTDAPLQPTGVADISSAPYPVPAPPPPSPSGFLSDLALDDVLFADIDTSMYDFDPCTTSGAVVGVASGPGAVSVGGGSGLAKLAPVVTADDLLKSLASPYSGPTPQVSANQPFKIDLTELDHIMEVLVGS